MERIYNFKAEYTKYIAEPALGESGVGGAMAVYGAFDAIVRRSISTAQGLAVCFNRSCVFVSPYVSLPAVLMVMLVAVCISVVGFLFLTLMVEKAFSCAD
ncbi:hypothetical protein HYC85_007871 [Camellia sinensis]|uniref:Uncharacterized protein n=1 Tax=Camellia sinensis TaxID=4442 RepID=A0A7J7HR26_CAMSI|nr:hypothetical protein HYC85_007871 [Camellia sinensis]